MSYRVVRLTRTKDAKIKRERTKLYEEFKKMYMDPRGWITPKGQYVHAEMYKHIENLSEDTLDDQELSRMLREWSEEKENREAEHQEYADMEGNKNAEWHVYEMWLDDAEPDFRKKFTVALYEKGWVRVGYSCRGDGSIVLIELEGTQMGLDGTVKAIDDLLVAGQNESHVKRTVIKTSS